MNGEGVQSEVKENHMVKLPPSTAMKSLQYDLFSFYVANDLNEVSSTVEFWDSIPKYFLTAKQIEKLRTSTGHADPYEHEYIINLRNHEKTSILPYKVEIQPALIKQADGNYLAFFPTKTEETIEEVLKKIFSDQQYGIHDPDNMESWVKFSYSMIRRELYRMGRGLRYDQIKHSLMVMSKSVITVKEDGKEIYSGSILQDYCSIDRNKYLDHTQALHAARLPVFISHSLNSLQYRQYNYARFMECKEQLTRFLYKRLVNRFVQANYMNEYSFRYSDIKQASRLLHYIRERDNRIKVMSAFDELKERGVILSYQVAEKKKGRKITDVVYTITSAPDFIREQKASNKRAAILEERAHNAGLNTRQHRLPL